MKITMAHGSGGKETSALIAEVFAGNFSNEVLNRMEDSAVVEGNGKIAVTTDSFVVNPYFFAGGDIGRLSVCGTVNDLLMSGAVPEYITCGFILQEGADIDDLKKIAKSMAETAEEAGVQIIAGDTKVIEGNGDIYINTAGVGFVRDDNRISSSACKTGDAIILSGTLGEHHCAILSKRMGIENSIKSDCAPLTQMVTAMLDAGICIKAMRDVTRGGLATVLNEIALASGCCAEIYEDKIPVSSEVKGLCGILGLDPLYMGNEGKMVAVVDKNDAEKAVSLIKASRYGENAVCIGEMVDGCVEKLLLKTALGGTRIVSLLCGEGLPRIC